MEEKFLIACAKARMDADALGIRIRPIQELSQAKRILAGHKDSDSFSLLAQKGRLDLSLEALAVNRQFTALFTDEEANNALMRLLDAGYPF